MAYSRNQETPGRGEREIPAVQRELLDAARAGRLAQFLAANPRSADAALYTIISEVVYQHLTRPREAECGHFRCIKDLNRMEPDCHDRHQDQVAAVRAYLLAHAGEQFENLPGWLTSRLTYIVVDAHRRDRSERGALQRPRLPGWLAAELGEDGWLRKLAVNILDWVGVPTTAGHRIWPLWSWAQQRALFRPWSDISEAEMEAEVTADVDRVLAAMRTRPTWYEAYVERPLGHKRAPLASTRADGADGSCEPEYVRYLEPGDADDALLAELASAAIEAITERIARGAPAHETVAEVLGLVFGTDDGSPETDRPPNSGRDPDPLERAARLILDPEVLDRVVGEVLRIIARSET